MTREFYEFVFLLLSYCSYMGHVEGIKDAGDYAPLPKRAPLPRTRPAKAHPVGRREKELEQLHLDSSRGEHASCGHGSDCCEWCSDNLQHGYRQAMQAWKQDLRDWLDHDDHMDNLSVGTPDALAFLNELDEEYGDWAQERWERFSDFIPGPDSAEHYWNIHSADDVAYAVYYGMDFQDAAEHVEYRMVNLVKTWGWHRDPALVGRALAEVEKTYQLRALYYNF